MTWLGRLLWRRRARAVADALGRGSPNERIVIVVDCPALAFLLNEQRWRVVSVSGLAPRRARTGATTTLARETALPIAGGAVGALVGYLPAAAPCAERVIREWARAVRDGGVIAAVSRSPREDVAGAFLCAGLFELEQRVVGRASVTSGRVRAL